MACKFTREARAISGQDGLADCTVRTWLGRKRIPQNAAATAFRALFVLRTILIATQHNLLYQQTGAVCRAMRMAMAAIPAGAHFDYLLFAPAPAALPKEPAEKLQSALTNLFPDLLVYGTHNNLLSMTTALTKVSGRAHQYFARLSQILAFERMMRSFFRFAAAASPFFAPVSAFSSDFLISESWKRLFFIGGHHTQSAPWPYLPYASATLPSPPGMPFLSSAFQLQTPAARHAQSWPDFTAMFFLPMALWAALPPGDSGWTFAF
jgi:hypothetical protein